MSRSAPDIAGFADALREKRERLGVDILFLGPPVVVWPAGTAIDPESGDPYDPMIDPVSSGQSSAVVRCSVFFKAINRGGADHAAVYSQIGLDEHTRIFAIAPIEAKPLIKGLLSDADPDRKLTMVYHDDLFAVSAIKVDSVLGGYERLLIYAGVEG